MNQNIEKINEISGKINQNMETIMDIYKNHWKNNKIIGQMNQNIEKQGFGKDLQ